MPSTRTQRVNALTHVDVTDLAAVRLAVDLAQNVGHWRRLLGIFGDHLPNCATIRDPDEPNCDCGFDAAIDS